MLYLSEVIDSSNGIATGSVSVELFCGNIRPRKYRGLRDDRYQRRASGFIAKTG